MTAIGIRNWAFALLALILFAAGSGLLLAEGPPPPDSLLTAPEAFQQAEAGERLLIDLRTPAEWRRTGRPKHADAIDFNGTGRGGTFVARVVALTEGARDAPIALICARGGRSLEALALLRRAGFTDVLDVHEGMLGNSSGPGWLERGLPLEQWPSSSVGPASNS